MNTNMVVVGKVLKPRGLKGEVKIQVLTNKAEVFESASALMLDKKKFEISRGMVQGQYAYCLFKGVDSIEKADLLRGMPVRVERSALNLADDEILASDLIGFKVEGARGEWYGSVVEVENHGGSDVIVTEQHSFPYEDEFVVETNMQTRTIIVRDEMMLWEEEA